MMTGGGALRISAPISVGNMVEILKDRLYFATYEGTPSQDVEHHYFSTDEDYHYESFFSDFGPFNLAVLYRYCTRLQRKLKLVSLAKKRIIHHTSPAGEKRVNAAYLIGSFAIIYLNKSADDLWRLIDQSQPPTFLPFRDAAAGPSSYDLNVSDVFRSVEKAVKFKWLDFQNFNVDEYEFYEKVENGDFNWVLPDKLLAFCGPHAKSVLENGYPHHSPETYFDYFRQHNVTGVVRLNKKLYDASRFLNAGFQHYDMYFVDGSVPSDAIVCKFIEAAESAPGALAVHCKAGLGRTGTLIACYMMKHFKLTAAECMAWIRICRPGSIIGPQQQFLIDKQDWCWSLSSANLKSSGSMSQILSKVDDIKITDNNNRLSVELVGSGSDVSQQNEKLSETNGVKGSENQLESDTFSQGDQLMRIKARRSSGRFKTEAYESTKAASVNVPTSTKSKPIATRSKKPNVLSMLSSSVPAKAVVSAVQRAAGNSATHVSKKADKTVDKSASNVEFRTPSTPTFAGPVRKAAKTHQGSDVTSSAEGVKLAPINSSASNVLSQAAFSRRLAVPPSDGTLKSNSKQAKTTDDVALGIEKKTGGATRSNVRRAVLNNVKKTAPIAASPSYYLRRRLNQPATNGVVEGHVANGSLTMIRQPPMLTNRKLPTVYKTSGKSNGRANNS